MIKSVARFVLDIAQPALWPVVPSVWRKPCSEPEERKNKSIAVLSDFIIANTNARVEASASVHCARRLAAAENHRDVCRREHQDWREAAAVEKICGRVARIELHDNDDEIRFLARRVESAIMTARRRDETRREKKRDAHAANIHSSNA